uniref:Uncharacterized protein n=1 Tax=Rhizophora mucronata TaxID=61149 RepID=A0A2P2LBJ5_RHIMU
MGYSEEPETLPLSPPEIPPNVVPIQPTPDLIPEANKKASKPKWSPMSRCGTGFRGQRIQLLSNHFKVGVSSSGGYFFHYSVRLFFSCFNLPAWKVGLCLLEFYLLQNLLFLIALGCLLL